MVRIDAHHRLPLLFLLPYLAIVNGYKAIQEIETPFYRDLIYFILFEVCLVTFVVKTTPINWFRKYIWVLPEQIKEDKLGFKKFTQDDKPMTEGPFYATPMVLAVHHTMGGIQINSSAQVLDKNGNVIPGLFAAGEVTGCVHGSNRVGGNGIAHAMVFGRISGQSALR